MSSRGVYLFAGRWTAFITLKKRKHYLGRYTTQQQAIEARDNEIVSRRLSYQLLNQPQSYPAQTELRCPHCDTIKPVSEFARNIRGSYKIAARTVYTRLCVECRPAVKKYGSSNLTAYKNKNPRCFWTLKLAAVRQRARKRGLECTVTLEDVLKLWSIQNGKCALCGRPMLCLAGSGNLPDIASLDRLKNEYGYCKDNLRMVHSICNVMRNNLSDEMLVSRCKSILAHLQQ